jgi:hypothetical protein
MNRADQIDFVADGTSPARRTQFRMSEEAVSMWQQTHPFSLDDYLEFLEGLQSLVGPLEPDRAQAKGSDLRL